MGWRRSRDTDRVAVLLLVVCLIADMAPPLMPGAFRFDPSESIEAVAVRSAQTVTVASVELPRPSDTGLAVRYQAPRARSSTKFSTHRLQLPLSVPLLLRASETNGSSDAPDDD
jgi:hypothetical protein